MSKGRASAYDITGSWPNYRIERDGVVVRSNITSFEAACCAVRNFERRVISRMRSCMCCGREFRSSGPGNRLCYDCNARARKMMF